MGFEPTEGVNLHALSRSATDIALIYYAELITFVELTPWDAPPYREDKPDGNMRKIVFGRAGEGIAVYLILED